MTSFLIQNLRRMSQDENGSAITEYAVVLGLVFVAAIALIANFGTRVLARWNSVNEQLDGTKAVHAPPAPIR